MVTSEKKLCIFIHFCQDAFLPTYVELFLEELMQYFDEVILITNERVLGQVPNHLNSKIRIMFVKNEGYDLGMFYKAYNAIKPDNYNQIACVNDSNVLINSLTQVFDWSKKHQYDMWGLVDSFEIPPFTTHMDNYHIQSHFLVFNKKAINLLQVFFQEFKFEELCSEKDLKKLRERVIDQWEIGLSQFFIKNGLQLGSFIDYKSFSKKHSIKGFENLSYRHYFRLIEEGYPLIKKKIITKKSSLKLIAFPGRKWDSLILKHGNKNWPLEEIVEDFKRLNLSQKSAGR